MYYILFKTKATGAPWGMATQAIPQGEALERARVLATANPGLTYRVVGTEVEMSGKIIVEETTVQ